MIPHKTCQYLQRHARTERNIKSGNFRQGQRYGKLTTHFQVPHSTTTFGHFADRVSIFNSVPSILWMSHEAYTFQSENVPASVEPPEVSTFLVPAPNSLMAFLPPKLTYFELCTVPEV